MCLCYEVSLCVFEQCFKEAMVHLSFPNRDLCSYHHKQWLSVMCCYYTYFVHQKALTGFFFQLSNI